jgi:hypothetical protein
MAPVQQQISEYPVLNLSYDFTIEEPRAKEYFTRVVNPVTHRKSNGQMCIQVDSAIVPASHPKSDGCPSNNVYLWFEEKDLQFFMMQGMNHCVTMIMENW